MNRVMREVQTIHKGTTVKITEHRSYTAVSHDDVTGLLHGPLTNAGIIAAASMDSCEIECSETVKEYQGKQSKSLQYMAKVWASITFINIDDPTDRINLRSFAYALDSGDKAVGKAYSMAVKYIYLKGFMLESLDDEESRDNEKGWGNKFNAPINNSPVQNRPVPSNANTPQASFNGMQASSPQRQLPTGQGSSEVKASEKQIKALEKLGIKCSPDTTMKQASELIAGAFKS